jgi:short-subunit dehydrogenase
MSKDQSQGLAIITGASTEIGSTYADRLAARGYQLLLVDCSVDRLKELVARTRGKYGTKVSFLVADLERHCDLARLMLRFGENDVTALVNGVEVECRGRRAKASAEHCERLIFLHIAAMTRLSYLALEGFRERGTGTLINISPMLTRSSFEDEAVYNGSNAYVRSFTRLLQIEYAKSSIGIQAVTRGPIHAEHASFQVLRDAIFPAHSNLTPEQMVDAAMARLAVEAPVLESWTTLI